ncbi:hypothetical protein TELCIR_01630 [Teladorsagia circumcincta]|uniref:G-protein coupled receptors family 1 profile domain-containing protein n=1 Tax=Teladorsagia circumcincta TaxID=45464 RepID=A0A2G9V1D8_TELCI|nr:hypothetical protein TELCIR_01630 [Teladorsagia circumcincta]
MGRFALVNKLGDCELESHDTPECLIKCLLRKSERDRRMQGRRRLIKILLILVVSYGICWYPLYIINSIDYFLPRFSIAGLTLWAVVLSHVSCALNPLIYAYGMPGFKKVPIGNASKNLSTNADHQA